MCFSPFFFREFQPMAFALDNRFLLSDQDINQFLMEMEIEPYISYITIKDFTSTFLCRQIDKFICHHRSSSLWSQTPFPRVASFQHRSKSFKKNKNKNKIVLKQ